MPAALIAVALSALVGLYVRLREPYVTPESDAATYVAIAKRLLPGAEHHLASAVDGLAMRGTTYPLLIAAVLAVTGSLAVVAWVQSLVLVPATVLLLFLAGRRAFSVSVGLGAAWLYALWLPAQIYTSLLMQETWLAFLVALTLYLLARVITTPTTRGAVALGLCSGVMAVTHSAFQILGIVLVAAVGLHWLVYDRSRMRSTVVVAVGLAAILLPSMVIRQVADLPQQGQGAVGWGAGGGWTFWQGSNPQTNFTSPPYAKAFANITDPAVMAQVQEDVRTQVLPVDDNLRAVIEAKPAGSLLTDSDFYSAGISNLLSEPTAWPMKIGNGIRALTAIPDGVALYRTAPSEAAPAAPWTLLATTLFALAIAGVLCLLAWQRNRLIMALPFGVQFVVVVAAFPENRHAIPLWGSWMLFTAVFTGYAVRGVKAAVSSTRDLHTVGRAAAVLLVAVSVVAAGRAQAAWPPLDTGVPITPAQVAADRALLRQTVFGSQALPTPATTWRPAPDEPLITGAEQANVGVVDLPFGLTANVVEYVPGGPSGCGLIVHGGHGPWQLSGGLDAAEQALADGCRVIAIDMPAQGRNLPSIATLDNGTRIQLQAVDGLHNAFYQLPTGPALSLFFLPVVAATDRLATTGGTIDMTGLSGGGWTTSVAAALDPRITRSLSVAGFTTLDVDQPCGGDFEQCLPELYSVASMEQIYALAAIGPGREHVQILNFYDPCCFAGSDGPWTEQVQESVAAVGLGGEYVFIADRTEPGTHAYAEDAFATLSRWHAQPAS